MPQTTSVGPLFSHFRKDVLVGKLPDDFLRLNEPSRRNGVVQLRQSEDSDGRSKGRTMGRLNLTIVQAKLVKSYSLVRMDPYVRVRVGHHSYKTYMHYKGDLTPRWNEEIRLPLHCGVNSVHLEIYDSCSLTPDKLIAWAKVPIEESVLKGETVEVWYPLNGKQGVGREGLINMVMSFAVTKNHNYRLHYQDKEVGIYNIPQITDHLDSKGKPELSVTYREDINHISDIFPHLEKGFIQVMYESNRRDKNATVNHIMHLN